MRKSNKLPSFEKLHELLDYDQDTGELRWRVSRGSAKAGSVAGCINPITGYRQIRIDGKSFKAHRIAWKMVTGLDPINEIDHIDRQRDNNCFKNLRDATTQQNLINRPLFQNNSSGVRGVYRDKPAKKWRARIWIHGKEYHLGMFDSLADAAIARREAEIKYFKNEALFVDAPELSVWQEAKYIDPPEVQI